MQLKQSVLEAPLHVLHDESHTWHSLLVSAYLATGVQEAKHVEGAFKNGYDVEQLVHSPAAGPVQVAHEASQPTQVSAEVLLPPEQVKPDSMVVQSPLQPSRLMVLPSSHASLPTRRPSPQTDTHESLLVILPPSHMYPASIVQFPLQPSPAAVLLSSHSSDAIQSIRLASPHLGEHVSSPPTPLPSLLDEMHSNPSSTRQSASQPSPPAVLLSSHTSAVLRMPLPQI